MEQEGTPIARQVTAPVNPAGGGKMNTCETCGGDGFLLLPFRPCPACRGNGQVSTDDSDPGLPLASVLMQRQNWE